MAVGKPIAAEPGVKITEGYGENFRKVTNAWDHYLLHKYVNYKKVETDWTDK